MARLLRVGLESFFKLLLRFDKGHRVTTLPANSKELVNGWRTLVLLQLREAMQQLKSWHYFGDHLPVDICECLGNGACDSIRHKQSLQG
jgi:hypothetical protein